MIQSYNINIMFPLNNQIAGKRGKHTIYEIGNIFCLEISGGCEGPAAPVIIL